MHKKCRQCLQDLSKTEFSKRSDLSDGLATICKKCDEQRVKILYETWRRDRTDYPLEKTCRACGNIKSSSEFGINNAVKDGLQIYCRDCVSLKGKAYHEKYPEKQSEIYQRYTKKYPGRRRLSRVCSEYKITPEEFFALSPTCEICDTEIALGVDHDHKTGLVRGMLCRGCNSGLGMLKDDKSLLVKAAEYLESFQVATVSQPTSRKDMP